MSTVSSKEKNMLMITVVVVLYAFAALCFKKQLGQWKTEQKVYAAAQKKLQDESALIAAKDEWAAKYEQMRDLMPVFPYEKDVDTHWLNLMDSAATRNGFSISRRQTNKEVEVGDVYELPIDCKDWEGSLESLVKFLYDLNQEGAMLDVRQLFVRPSAKPGYLKGTFTLYCAYMRGAVEKQKAPAPASTPPAAAAEDLAPSAEAPQAEMPQPEPAAPQAGTNG
jgi:Tfp pilus assembly protein PilO